MNLLVLFAIGFQGWGTPSSIKLKQTQMKGKSGVRVNEIQFISSVDHVRYIMYPLINSFVTSTFKIALSL